MRNSKKMAGQLEGEHNYATSTEHFYRGSVSFSIHTVELNLDEAILSQMDQIQKEVRKITVSISQQGSCCYVALALEILGCPYTGRCRSYEDVIR